MILVHEVRRPVAALAAIAQACTTGRLETSERRPLVELAIAACRGIERLVTDAALASVRRGQVDIGRLVDEAVAAAVLGGGNVRAEVDGDLPLLRADPLRLRQALDNLVSNAVRHAGSTAEVLVSAQQGDGAVLLSVADTGAGVSLDDQQRIFEAGVRLSSGRSGSGLGLAVARAIAAAHGGTLSVDSAPEQGATLSIVFPVGSYSAT
ncbi:MAG: sensor histidine kinase, partial [Gaiellaceae bacterium]